MRTGRPPIPIAVKRAQGDTRQRGALKHEAAMASAYEARRGRPEMPACLKSSAGDSQEAKALLAVARKHWSYVADSLESEALLSLLDEGMLTSLALNYAQMVVAAKAGEPKVFAELQSRYMQVADRMGLSESARARLPRKKEPPADPLMGAMCG